MIEAECGSPMRHALANISGNGDSLMSRKGCWYHGRLL